MPKQKPKIVSREFQVKRFANVPPSDIFYNPNSIKWFRKKYNEDLIKKSIYSLFPNNCLPCMNEDEITPMYILLEWLSTYLKPKDKYKHVWINPKYFFTKEVYEKVLKLKEIFLQFDEDGSRKMEIDEMVTMFKTNHINVTEDDLCSLFFKGKKFRKEDINKLYLDFFQFMKFALSKASDQDFRIFMRNIKEKIIKEKEKEKKEEDEENKNGLKKKEEIQDDLFVDEKKEPIFLPMNFNLLLDYFINKGKERKSQKKIRKAIKMMRNILKPGSYPDDDKDFLPDEGEEESNKGSASSSDSEESKNLEDEYDRQLKEINTEEIMQEFEKLFKMSYVTNDGNDKKNRRRSSLLNQNLVKDIQIDINVKKQIEENKKKDDDSSESEKSNKNEDISSLKNNLNEENKMNTEGGSQINSSSKKKILSKKKLLFTNVINDEMTIPNIKQLERYYYDKYHSVQLAKSEAKKFMEDYIKDQNNKLNKNKKSDKLPTIKDRYATTTYIGNNAIRHSNALINNKDFGFRRKLKKSRFLY